MRYVRAVAGLGLAALFTWELKAEIITTTRELPASLRMVVLLGLLAWASYEMGHSSRSE